MATNKKKLLDKEPVLYISIGICLVLLFISYLQQKNYKHIKEVSKLPFYNVKVEDVVDVTYLGKTYTSFMNVQLEVTVLDHQITDIQVIENAGSKGKKVEPILEQMIAQNKSVVQAIKGEELASIVFITCVDDALKKGSPLDYKPVSLGYDEEPAQEENQSNTP